MLTIKKERKAKKMAIINKKYRLKEKYIAPIATILCLVNKVKIDTIRF